MTANFALVGSHTCLKLYGIDARDQKENAKSEYGDKLPYPFGDKKGGITAESNRRRRPDAFRQRFGKCANVPKTIGCTLPFPPPIWSEKEAAG